MASDWKRTQPVDGESGRYICTEFQPRPKGANGRWMHPDAKVVGSHDPGDGGDCDDMRCPHCGMLFDEYYSQ